MTEPDKELSGSALLDVLAQSPNATAVYTSHDLHISFANDAMLHIWGKNRSIIGKTFTQALPEMTGQPFAGLLQNVWASGQTYIAAETPANIEIDGILTTGYFDFEYKAMVNRQGDTYAILHTAVEVSDRMTYKRLVQEKAAREQTLNEELTATNEELASLNEEYIVTNEELSALNEEYISTNEELSAVNEEYTAANEELATLNEELSTLNEEYITLNEHVNLANKNLENLNRELTISEQKANLVIGGAPVAIGILNGQNLILESANQRLLNLWGKSSDIVSKSLHDGLPEFAGTPLFDVINRVFSSGETYYGNDTARGLTVADPVNESYFNFVYQPVKDDEGNTASIIIVASDVTEQRNATQQIATSLEQARLAKQAANLGVFDLDVVNNRLEWDTRCKELFGLNAAAAVSYVDDFVNGLHPDDRQRIEQAVADAYNFDLTQGRYDVEYRTVGAEDKKLRWVRAIGQVSFDADKKPLRFIGTVIDIGEQKEDEQRKNDFIGMVSHELKTPLTTLNAYLQVLQTKADKMDDAFSITAITKSNAQVKKMTAMINGFLNVSRLESGKIHIDKKRFSIADLLHEVQDESHTIITSHQVIFEPVEDVEIVADRDKIAQVINNFISNAVKYSPPGSTVQVSAGIIDGKAVFSVTDRGMGIDRQYQKKLFERFYRVRDEQTENISGFGIGLYLCAQIIERHKGKIGVESQPGSGSRFWFSLPLS